MTEEMVEMLIGKYLDGEITPIEQRMLEQTLQKDSQAKELFEQWQDLHRASQEAIDSEILDRGKTAEETFERAWQQTKQPLRRVIKGFPKRIISRLGPPNMSGRLRFAVGLAAGLIIGLTLHFTLFAQLTRPGYEAPATQVAKDTSSIPDPDRPVGRSSMPDSGGNVVRNVDWYSFTDEDGQQWLIERVRQNNNAVRPAVYHEGL